MSDQFALPTQRAAGPYALELRGITRRFDRLLALSGVDLAVRPGQIHGVVGENGAGKTTLMNIAAGLLPPDKGEILVDGRRVRFGSPRQAAAAGIGMVHQHFMLVEPLTVAESLLIGRRAYGWRAARRRVSERIDELSARLGLAVDPHSRIEQLSVGQRQRVEIVRALLSARRVLILDEPTAVLTPQETDGLFAAIDRLRADGSAVVFISHKLDEVRRVCDVVTVLRQGRRVRYGQVKDLSPEELTRDIVGSDLPAMTRPPATPADAPAVLQLNDVTARDDETGRRLGGVNLSVRAGEIYGLAGVEGNGQDLLARVIFGLAPVSSGRVMLDSQDVARRSTRRRFALGMSHIPEDRTTQALIGEFSLTENLVLTGHWRRPFSICGLQDWAAARRAAAAAIRRFDVRAPDLLTPAARLSGGNQQKLVLARELLGNPKLIVAHNPARGLDVAAAAFVFDQLLSQRHAGAAILLINSDLDELLAVSDRIGVIYGGRLLETAWPQTSRAQIGRMMLTGLPANGAA